MLVLAGLTNAINQQIAHGSIDFGRVVIAAGTSMGSDFSFGKFLLPKGMDEVAAAILGTTAETFTGFCMDDWISKEPNYMGGIKSTPEKDKHINFTPVEGGLN